ncbi:hypothetical protein R1sor_024451 [Riccia sorocarpa]|uniref:DDE Tnp4 domain-containing protein n=1 Tax=Riccia sorocarpa TaxID=122646 RepID=A0ABD3GQJ3_9MARC
MHVNIKYHQRLSKRIINGAGEPADDEDKRTTLFLLLTVFQLAVHLVLKFLDEEEALMTGNDVVMDDNAESDVMDYNFNIESAIVESQGAIDGSHILIRSTGGDQHQRDYSNRKDFYSILIQTVVDSDGVFLDTFCGLPGSVHDTRVLRNSPFFENVAGGMFLRDLVVTINGVFQLPPYILGESGYTQEIWLMCPFSLNRNSRPQQRLFTERKIRGRIVVEQTFGILKSRFKILDGGILSSVSYAATVILHNYLIRDRLNAMEQDMTNQNLRQMPHGGGGVQSSKTRHNGHDVRTALAEYLFSTQ